MSFEAVSDGNNEKSLKLNWLHNKEFQNVNNNSMENKIFCVCSGVNYQPFWRKIVRNIVKHKDSME